MKNIMNTTLVAVAVAIACVGNVDARTMVRKGSDASVIVNAARNAMANPSPENRQALADSLDSAVQSADEATLTDLRKEKADLIVARDLKKLEMDNLNYGYFGFGTTEQTQIAHRTAKAELATINADLKSVQSRIDTKEKTVGKPYSNALKYGIGVAAALGITVGAAVATDLYLGKGYTKGAIAGAGQVVTRARKAAGDAYDATADVAKRSYRRVRGTTPVVETPAPKKSFMQDARERMYERSTGYAN